MVIQIKVYSSLESVDEQLAKLGLTSDQIKQAVLHGQAARNNTTPHHPANAGGSVASFETVRSLRDILVPKGWVARNAGNLSTTANPEGNILIVVSSGSEETGIAEGYPTTRNEKGPKTEEYVSHNQAGLFDDFESPVITDEEAHSQTWLLLHYYDKEKNELRAELSLPVDFDADSRVNGWKTRILLEPIPLGGEDIEIKPEYTPDIDIDIEQHK